jgi:hypothetical protein
MFIWVDNIYNNAYERWVTSMYNAEKIMIPMYIIVSAINNRLCRD